MGLPKAAIKDQNRRFFGKRILQIYTATFRDFQVHIRDVRSCPKGPNVRRGVGQGAFIPGLLCIREREMKQDGEQEKKEQDPASIQTPTPGLI